VVRASGIPQARMGEKKGREEEETLFFLFLLSFIFASLSPYLVKARYGKAVRFFLLF